MNAAVVPTDTLERAKVAANLVFNLSGIGLDWVDASSCQAGCFTLRIVPVLIGGEKSRDPRVLGIAPSTKEGRATDAWIFYHRVQAHSATLGLDLSEMLGQVLAHELGHLLLPLNAHSLAGVMRPEWDRAQVKTASEGLLTFTPDQAHLIRERLRASAVPTPCAQ